MGTLTSFFGGGGSAAPLPVYTILYSNAAWIPPYNGTAYVHVIGAGGNAESYNAGAAGGYSRKLITLSTATACSITVGQASTLANGNGGASIFTDGTNTLTANGGAGGGNSLTSAAAGGTASGGDVNYTGGNGGYVGTTARNNFAGGGAVNLTGTAYAGGNATYDPSAPAACYGGGASITASPLDVGLRNSTSTNWVATGGAGTGGASNAVVIDTESGHMVYVQGGPAAVGKPDGVVGFDFIKEWGHGGSISSAYSPTFQFMSYNISVAGNGAGGAGGPRNSAYDHYGGSGGLFGGGGAGHGGGGNGGLGGGGGAPFRTFGTGNIKGGLGGNGVVYIEYVKLT